MAECNPEPTGYRRIKVFYTGGTIGMQKGADGSLVPIPNTFKDKIKSMPELHNEEEAVKIRQEDDACEYLLVQVYNDCKFVYNIKEYCPLLDSTNVAHSCWIQVAKDIKENYDDYHGFLVLHGTDTISYTASALSFMLENLRKPVVLTGSMIPIYQARTDATNNIICSLILAGCYDIPEVSIFCGNKLLRGNRTTKIDCDGLQAFDSPNYHPLAIMGESIHVDTEYIPNGKDSSKKFCIQDRLCSDVIVLEIYPGIKCETVRESLKPPVKGAVLRCFGAGNVPSTPELTAVFADAVQRQVLIVRITQCHVGSVNDLYAVGANISKAGVIPGFDMTVEAAYTKLCWVLARDDLSFENKREIMQTNVRGELTSETI